MLCISVNALGADADADTLQVCSPCGGTWRKPHISLLELHLTPSSIRKEPSVVLHRAFTKTLARNSYVVPPCRTTRCGSLGTCINPGRNICRGDPMFGARLGLLDRRLRRHGD